MRAADEGLGWFLPRRGRRWIPCDWCRPLSPRVHGTLCRPLTPGLHGTFLHDLGMVAYSRNFSSPSLALTLVLDAGRHRQHDELGAAAQCKQDDGGQSRVVRVTHQSGCAHELMGYPIPTVAGRRFTRSSAMRGHPFLQLHAAASPFIGLTRLSSTPATYTAINHFGPDGRSTPPPPPCEPAALLLANSPFRFSQALSHARKTAINHFRPDGSTYHRVVYNSSSGAVIQQGTVQVCTKRVCVCVLGLLASLSCA